MSNYRVSLSFINLSDPVLDEFASNIVVSLTGNAAFPTPLVPLADLGAAQSAFHDALLAAAQAPGTGRKGAKTAKKAPYTAGNGTKTQKSLVFQMLPVDGPAVP